MLPSEQKHMNSRILGNYFMCSHSMHNGKLSYFKNLQNEICLRQVLVIENQKISDYHSYVGSHKTPNWGL
jgi:inhibitor of KinA sporulation pathway (predicted exonuclease)